MTHETIEPTATSTVTRLDRAGCLARLKVATVGRLGFVTARGLQIIPVNYRLDGQLLKLATTPHSSLAQLGEMGRAVTFEVDYAGPDLGVAWSVLMQGELRELDAVGHARWAQMPRPLEPFPGDAASVHLEFVPHSFSGRVLHHRWS
jgi:nitroimidazol reductase NimA-like FMN-containing flavoprotein (pyridoxamine 5'-phosphate oxidase superfamily)